MFDNIYFWDGLYSFFILLAILGIAGIIIEGICIIKQKIFTRKLYFRVKRRIKRNPELAMSENMIRLVMLEEIEKM